MTNPHSPIAEIVTFRLVDGAKPTDFVTAAQALTPMLAATGHVKSRTLSMDADGTWTDHIIWTSMEVAKATAEQMMADPAAAPMMQMIDPENVQMRHAPIQYQQE